MNISFVTKFLQSIHLRITNQLCICVIDRLRKIIPMSLFFAKLVHIFFKLHFIKPNMPNVFIENLLDKYFNKTIISST